MTLVRKRWTVRNGQLRSIGLIKVILMVTIGNRGSGLNHDPTQGFPIMGASDL